MAERIALDLPLFRERLAEVRETAAAHAPGEAPRIVVITKYLAPEDTRLLRDEGVGPLGENRSDDLVAKTDGSDRDGWQFVGHLQRNKISKVAPRVGLLHSLDHERTADALESWAGAHAKISVLVQINVSGEETKGGLSPEEARRRLPDWVERYPHLRFRGLMTMAPLTEPEACRPFFRRLRELRDELAAGPAGPLPELSMGMSNDYRVAAEEGATLLRIGRTLFTRPS